MKKVIYLLAAWFLLEWVYTTKIKPFITSEFGPFGNKAAAKDSAVNPVATDSLPPIGSTTGSYVYGLDISHYQGDETEMPFKLKDSLTYVICKATDGKSDKSNDTAFKRNWENIRNEGLIRGAFHYYRNRDSPEVQANHFLKICNSVGGILSEDLPPAVDVEDKGVNKEDLLKFLSIIKVVTHRIPIIYTDWYIASTFLNDPAFADYPLWLANGGNSKPIVLPGAWKRKEWFFWQRHKEQYINSTKNDFDVFNGSKNDLKNFIRYH